MSSVAATIPAQTRGAGAFVSAKHRRRYYTILIALIVLAAVITFGLLGYNNQQDPFTEKWWRIAGLRASAVVVIAIVTFAQSFGTVTASSPRRSSASSRCTSSCRRASSSSSA
jgi:iron complex transport system permease protein